MFVLALFLLQAAVPACAAPDADLPLALKGWTSAGTSFVGGGAVTIAASEPERVVPPQKPGKVATLDFSIATGGSFRIALDQPGWIDVTKAGEARPLVSSAHDHGPVCSTIRKLVAYDLAAGSYRLTVSGLAKPAAKVLLIPAS